MAWQWANLSVLDRWLDAEVDAGRRATLLEALATILERVDDDLGDRVAEHPNVRVVSVRGASVEVRYVRVDQFHALHLIGIYEDPG